MNVSLRLVQYCNQGYQSVPDPYSYGVDEIVGRIGAQLGAVEDVTYTGKKYDGVLVARVVTCDKHPDADKLSLCMVDDGGVMKNVERNDEGLVQVVCGAPNVAAGQTVAWLPPGSTVPSTYDKDQFVLEARELRGKVSNGMIASPKELDISDEHEGILEINVSEVGEDLSQPGTEFKKLYGLDDVIIDCENKMFTHRPDCFGVMGVAREIAGIFGDAYNTPEWYRNALENPVDETLPLEVKNEIQDLVPRFTVQSVSNVEIKKSPLWLQIYLKNNGSNSINNIVDYTNYYMMLTSQPLHAFDYDKVKALNDAESVAIFPRMAEDGEELALLNGKTVKLNSSDIVISTDKRAIALGGVMGGADTEVDENTKNIIVECANFDMYTIRRTSMRHGLFTDAVTRFNKGQSPLQNDKVLAKMVDEVIQNAAGTAASPIYDITSFDLNADNLNHISTSVGFINSRLGSHLNADEIKKMLENVEFVVAGEGENLEITAPFWRMDIAIPEDIVEEVGRLYGYDNLPVSLPARSSKASPKNQQREFQQVLRSKLSRGGANEVLTYSFVHGDLMRNAGVDPDEWAFHLRNALSPDLQYYRTALIPSLLAKVHGNLKAGAGTDKNEFAIFEFGKVHIKGHNEDDSDLPKQMNRLSLVFAADKKTQTKYAGSPYYAAKKYLDDITGGRAVYEPLGGMEYPMTSSYAKGRSAMVKVDEQVLGVIGEFHPKAKKSMKLPEFCAGFELDIDLLMAKVMPSAYKPLSTFPSTAQDITLEVAADMNWQHVYDFVHAEIAVSAAEDDLSYTVEPLDIFRPEDSGKSRISFRMELAHHKKTLKKEEVNSLLDHVEKQATETLNAKRI